MLGRGGTRRPPGGRSLGEHAVVQPGHVLHRQRVPPPRVPPPLGRDPPDFHLPDRVLGVHTAPVTIGACVPIGSGTIVLPGVDIGEGAAVGAMSLVPRSLAGWAIYAGNPAVKTGDRARDVAHLAATLDGSR